jgi:hypothetical protein
MPIIMIRNEIIEVPKIKSTLLWLQTDNILRGLSPRANYTDRRLSAKLVPTFARIGLSRSQPGGSPKS